MFPHLADLTHWQIALTTTALLLQGALFTAIPEEIVITTLGFLWHEGRIGFFEALFAIQLGLLSANALIVFVGKTMGWKILRLKPFCWFVKKEAIVTALSKIERYGARIVFMTRFTPVIRGPVYLAVGLSRISLSKFVLTDTSASFFQIPLLLLLGYTVGQQSSLLLELYRWVGVLVGLCILVLVLFMRNRKTAKIA